LLALAALLAFAGAGCGSSEPDLENGKRIYTGEKKLGGNKQSCGACHALARAQSQATAGPDLDEAFATARRDGMNERTIQGVVEDQIAHPRKNSTMPPKLVEGDDARDVSAYIASVAGEPGKDTGRLASIGVAEDTGPIAAKGGVLTIPAVETGATRFVTDEATAKPGSLEIVMPNPSSSPHNIAIKGGPTGPVVEQGGRSAFKFNAKAGSYEYYCSVPGHEAGGMKGTLQVK